MSRLEAARVSGWGLALALAVAMPAPPGVSAAAASDDGARPVPIRWVDIPVGRFEMGCVPGDPMCRQDELSRHAVEVTRPYQLMTTGVTVQQFESFARATGRQMPRQPHWNEPAHPVVNITWGEALAVCEWLGGRLPTEAEWERAARGGVDGQVYPWGHEFDRAFANTSGQGGADRWWFTAPVGSFPANAFGLHDMIGNVWEWTADWYAPGFAPDAVRDPTGPATGTHKVIRGGSWDNLSARVRTSARYGIPVEARYNLYIGVRCAR